MKCRVVILVSVAVLILGFFVLSPTRGGIGEFSPYTLEYQTQSEYTIIGGAIPIYRSPRHDAKNELVTYLKQEGFVSEQRPQTQRKELVFHWNDSWRDGYGPLYDVFHRHRRQIIEWSQADRERAEMYWSEGFKYLRADAEWDVEIGREILRSGWRTQSTAELREQIAAVKREIAELSQ